MAQVAPAEEQKINRQSNGAQRHSQYNPYTANPQTDLAPPPAQQLAMESGDADDYISPSRPLPTMLVTASDGPALFTDLVRHSKSDERQDDSVNYVYHEAVPAQYVSNEQDVAASGLTEPADYMNASDCKAAYDPPYVNGKCTPTADMEERDSVRSKAPIPVPRSSGTGRRSGPTLDRVPSGLYVEEVDVGDDPTPGKDQYVIPELEEHYSNSNQ